MFFNYKDLFQIAIDRKYQNMLETGCVFLVTILDCNRLPNPLQLIIGNCQNNILENDVLKGYLDLYQDNSICLVTPNKFNRKIDKKSNIAAIISDETFLDFEQII